ncbi:MAG: LptF/LptG family permease, partial [Prevotellaceae bacterium]|nr:LptF/LptG family permease [Prevotellaceae bacterium]
MKTLYRHIFLSYLGPMFLTLAIVVFIFVIQFVWLQIDELVGKGLTWNTILELLGWFAILNIPMSLPLSTLLASLMTLGNLGENNELLAMKSSGISLRRMLNPLYITIIVVAAGSFMLSSELTPYSYLKMRSTLMEIKRKSPELSIPEDIFYDGIERFVIRVKHKDPVTGALVGVMIYDHSNGEGNYSVTIADTGYIKQTTDERYIQLRLINGVNYSEELTKTNRLNKAGYPFHRRFFKEQTVSIDMGEEEAQSFEAMYRENAPAKSMTKLNRDSDSVNAKIQDIIDKFDEEQLNSTNAFKFSVKKDTAGQRIKPLSYDVDSIYNNATAIQKINYLNQVENSVSRIRGYWENELKLIQMETKKLKNIDYERNRKFTLAFTCIIFFFIGAPLGAIIRKGGLGLPVVISILFFVIYWVIDTVCVKMVRNSDWTPFFGAWFPSFILTPIAVFLTYKANTDSQIFNPDAYKHFFNVLFGRMKQLMIPVDFDKISLLPEEQRGKAMQENSDSAKRLKSMITNYLDLHKHDRMFQSRASILKMHNDQDLLEIKALYDYLLSFYATIDDDENVRTIIKQFPALEPSEFTFPKFLLSSNAFLKIPYTLIL